MACTLRYSEVKPQCCFELAELLRIHDGGVPLVLDESERPRTVDVQAVAGRSQIWHGMVEHVDGIHAHLDVPRFLDPNCLLQGRVEVPLSRQFQTLPAERASCSRPGILKQNLAAFRIRNGLKR